MALTLEPSCRKWKTPWPVSSSKGSAICCTAEDGRPRDGLKSTSRWYEYPACKLIRVLARFIATGRRSSGCGDLRRALRFVFRTILATGRTAAPLDLRHPGGRTTTAPAATTSQPFQGHDRFFHLFPFHPQLGQHLVDVHFVPLPRKLTFLEHARSEKRTRTCQLVESV